MADIEKKTKRYPTDLTDAEWERVRPFLPPVAKRGRKPTADMREMLNAIRYMARSGGGWRMLPTNFGPWQTVYWWFRRFVRRLMFRTIHDIALMIDRERVGREASPTADVQDAAGAELIVAAVRKRWPWLKHLFADGAYDRGKLSSLAAFQDFTLEVVRKLPEQKGFQVLRRRWVVERTFGWMTRWRRLVRDYEKRLDVSGAMIDVAMSSLLLRRVSHP